MMAISGAQRLMFLVRSVGVHPPGIAAIVGLEEVLRPPCRRPPDCAARSRSAHSSRSGTASHVGRRVDHVGRAAATATAAASACCGGRRPASPEFDRRGAAASAARWIAVAAAAAAGAPRPATGAGPDALLRAVAQIVTAHVAVLRLGVDDGPVGGILARVESVAAGDREPVGIHRAGGGAQRARSAPGVVVLQPPQT